ncbi:MAG: EAL domain-containing protein [Lachnospiraceae bacterium]|nr:EAL domain-containing protein [Lachnospiraceae bacterium]
MDFQKIVDGISTMACVVSVEKKGEDSYGEIRIVTGNKAYISSIENPAEGTQMLRDKFTPNSLYTDYLTRDLNFEDYSYRSAVQKKCLHSYAHPDRIDAWFNMMFIPLSSDSGDLCYCLYLMEINFEVDSSNMSEISSDVATSVVSTCIKLSGTTDFNTTIKDVIVDTRVLCDAEHCCILTVNEFERSCTVMGEAFAPGSPLLPMNTYLDGEFYDIVESWESTIAGSNCIIAKNEKDMELIKERNPVWYASLTGAGAHNIVLFPLKSRGELMGYMWALNFDESLAVKIKETLEVTTFILGSELGNHMLMDRLKNLGSKDMLTGVMNRNEMNNYVDGLANGKSPMTSVGVIFADLNGLKEVNDVEGHNAGDVLLKDAAEILCGVFDRKQIFRAGGDEFSIIMTGVTQEDLEKKMEAVEEKCRQDGSISIAMGGSVENDSRNVRMALRLADERMYENKKKYYSEFDIREKGRGKDRSAKESELLHRMNYDQLTGLPSMSFFFKLAETGREKMHEEGVDSAVLFLNLQGLGSYNKKYGYIEGDKLIREVAIVISGVFGEESCSRFEQDHFAAFVRTDGLEDRLKEIFRKLKGANSKKSLPMRVGIYPDSMGMVETSLACDRARYASEYIKASIYKSEFFYYDEKMLKQELNSKYVVENLDRAIKENWITAFFQPLVRSTSRRVCDEEALARWIDPEKGMLSPADFIPVLEDTKLIYKVDLHIVDVVIENYKRRKHDGFGIVPVSVNLSRADFDMCDIVEEICNRVDAAGMPRQLLTIEITESLIGENFGYMKEQVKRFQDLGFSVWMDDFGSGYSSLNLLQDMHFDVIKFDMQFMRQFDKNPKSRVMLAQLLRMAVRLGIETVTEGVETQEQVDFLCEAGCTRMQGYYFCKPLSMEEIKRRYDEGRQIGFEDPAEIAYHSVVSAINLYDLASNSGDEEKGTEIADNAQPVVILENDGGILKVIRSNKSYKKTAKAYSLLGSDKDQASIDELPGGLNRAFYHAMLECEEIGKKVFVNELSESGDTIHAFVTRIAENGLNNASAFALAIIGITPKSDKGLTFTGIARALSVDYIDIYQVDLDTERFTEYAPDKERSDFSVERRGTDFFATSRRDALQYIHESDRDGFISVFTKENVIKALDEHGVFSYTYRADFYGDSIYVNMKALRMNGDGNEIIIGVNNVDAQMREREAIDRLKEEKAAFSRISVLMGDVIAIYTVDPESGAYMQYSSSREYSDMGTSKVGTDFFGESYSESIAFIHPDDYERFRNSFTKENVLKQTVDGKVYSIGYRLKLGDDYSDIWLRAGRIKENDGEQLIVGVGKS